MPGGHCPIVRPHHPPNQKEQTWVGDPPFIVCGWCGAHTKQASDCNQDHTRRRSNLNAKRLGYESSLFVVYRSLAQRRCARTRVRVRVHVHVHACAPSPADVFPCIRITILPFPNHGFSTHVLGCQNGVRKPCFLDPKTTLRKVVFWTLFWVKTAGKV